MEALQLRHAAEVPTTGDAALVSRARRGDEAAFEAIMRRYNRRLYRLARGLVKDEDEAEDVVQETYVIAYLKLASFNGPDGLGAWLGRIAINEGLGRLRRGARLTSLDARAEQDEFDLDRLLADLNGRRRDPEADAAIGEVRRLLEQAIEALSPPFRLVFMLRAVEGLSIAETAATLGLKAETVKTRFHRARRELRKALSERVRSALGGVFPFAGARCDRLVAAVRARLGFAARIQ